ncbi:Na+/H+ antiporter subunit A [Citricoccus sp.]|uniref:Na+/H+ antiporter subunit A n=1 Tax=Citricoccus sp. TaxID=1978372 RepID=UPI002639CC37|nr:Na+/H+ antiporter subunit A [Citricoccus sp.]HRO29240.1 Na+/H+ antiporter subunit A [Citricoccus sp.]HRO92727.1 Na+/H+ antiporter subunit A [Citricoccus sp.]
MLTVLIALFAVALVAPIIFRFADRNGFYVLAAVPALGFVWLLFQLPEVLALQDSVNSGASPPSGAGTGLVQTYAWIPDLGIELSFRMDALAAFMGLIILGVGALVLAYCARYFQRHEARNASFGAQLVAFAGSMFGLVTTDDLIVLYTFWELTSVLSFLLIGYSAHRIFARRSAIQALVVTTLGGLSMLVGLVMLGQAAGTYRLSEIVTAGPELLSGPYAGAFMEWAIVLVLVGALSKSAQVPFHFWLPAAMAAPTPVSAYLHAAAMVKAGVYLVARLAPAFAESGWWQVLVIGVGLWTMLVGGWRALRQTDIKLILAYGTVSQLGFLMVANGLGDRDAAMAGLAMLAAHALFKAPLFMVVGIIDHEAGTRDLARLSGIGRNHPWLFGTAVVCAASMAGIPPLFGFVAKESVLESLTHWGQHGAAGAGLWASVWAWTPLVLVAVGTVLTVAYSARFLWGAFATKTLPTDEGIVQVEDTRFHGPVTASALGPSALLALACVAGALIPGAMEALPAAFGASMAPLEPGSEPAYLALWHGLTPVLGLSVAVILTGLVLYAVKDPVARFQAAVPSWVDAQRLYRASLAALDDVAIWVTGRTQRGSLSYYLFIILSVALLAPLLALLFPQENDGGTGLAESILGSAQWTWADTIAQVLVGAAMIVATFAAIRARKRFMAVLLISVTGYGLAAIFALQGAPDLALTQLLVESIVLVAMVLGLRMLPPGWYTRRRSDFKVPRAILGIAFGAVMVAVAVTALASRTAERISLEMPRLAYEEGGGANIVNVLLVDIRAWDTFGEIAVLAAAATGVASLVFIQHRDRQAGNLQDVASGSVGRYRAQDARERRELAAVRKFAIVDQDQWLVAGRTVAPERRSIIFEVVTRLIFHVIILLSIYLLLAGHNTPGGGFAGGLIAGLALTIRYLAGGRYELEQAMPIPAGVLLGSGLAIAALTGAVPLLFGGQVFQSAIVEFALPVIGDVKFVSSTVFDIGVYLVVVGLVIDVLRSLGSEVDRRSEAEGTAQAEAQQRRREAGAAAEASSAVPAGGSTSGDGRDPARAGLPVSPDAGRVIS